MTLKFHLIARGTLAIWTHLLSKMIKTNNWAYRLKGEEYKRRSLNRQPRWKSFHSSTLTGARGVLNSDALGNSSPPGPVFMLLPMELCASTRNQLYFSSKPFNLFYTSYCNCILYILCDLTKCRCERNFLCKLG